MDTSKVAVLYALNVRPLYWKLLELSITSIRQYDRKIKIHVYCFGEPPACARQMCRRLKFKLVQRAALKGRLAAWSLKWRCVGEISAHTVLALDVDTYFYAAPQKLLERYQKHDFYARKDIALGNDEKHGPLFIQNRLNNSVYKQVARSLGAKSMPVFNGSAMIWNRASQLRWKKKLGIFIRLAETIQNQNAVLGILKKDFFADEVAGSLCLGLIPNLSWGFIRSEDVTWYSEWKFKLIKARGTLMHVSTAYTKDWARHDLQNTALARELSVLGRADKVRFLDPLMLKALR